LFASLEAEIRWKLAELKFEAREADNEAAEQKEGERESFSPGDASDTCIACGRKPSSSAVMNSKRFEIT
jgi:hypothetical protein